MTFLWGLVGVIVGVLIIKYSFQITNLFGKIPWAEEHLRGGAAGTYTLYKLIGLVIIILSLLYMFGGMGFIVAPLGPLFGGIK